MGRVTEFTPYQQAKEALKMAKVFDPNRGVLREEDNIFYIEGVLEHLMAAERRVRNAHNAAFIDYYNAAGHRWSYCNKVRGATDAPGDKLVYIVPAYSDRDLTSYNTVSFSPPNGEVTEDIVRNSFLGMADALGAALHKSVKTMQVDIFDLSIRVGFLVNYKQPERLARYSMRVMFDDQYILGRNNPAKTYRVEGEPFTKEAAKHKAALAKDRDELLADRWHLYLDCTGDKELNDTLANLVRLTSAHNKVKKAKRIIYNKLEVLWSAKFDILTEAPYTQITTRAKVNDRLTLYWGHAPSFRANIDTFNWPQYRYLADIGVNVKVSFPKLTAVPVLGPTVGKFSLDTGR